MRFLYIAADNFRHPKEKSERIEPLNEIIRNVDILLQFRNYICKIFNIVLYK